MKVRYLRAASEELVEAIRFYDRAEAGLGSRFYAEIRNALDRITQFPDAWARLSENTRRCRTKVFPYGIIYQIRPDEILIVAISHFNRKPGYWKSRQ